MSFQDKLAKAKEAGYSDEEIQQYIVTKKAEAKAAGYSDNEIEEYLGGNPITNTGQPRQGQPMSEVASEGISPEIPGVSAFLSEGTVPMGEVIAETTSIPEAIRSPLAGVVGTAPELLGMAQLGKAAVKGLPSAVQNAKGIAQNLPQTLKKIGNRVLEGPATEQLRNLRNTVSELPVKKLAKETEIEQLRKQAGEFIEELREAAKVPQTLHDVSHVNVNSFANMMKKLDPKTKNLKVLLNLRDRADAVIRAGVDDTQRAFIRRGMSKLDEAIGKAGKAGEKIASAYKKYGETMTAADDIPADILKKRVASQRSIRELSPKAHREQLLRKLAAGALGAGGLYGIFK